MDEGCAISEIYGRKVGSEKSGIYHLYLLGSHGGIWNPDCLKSPEIILTESVIDTLTSWVNGLQKLLNEYELRRLMGQPDFTDPLGLRDRSILELLYATGMRRGELVGLGDID